MIHILKKRNDLHKQGHLPRLVLTSGALLFKTLTMNTKIEHPSIKNAEESILLADFGCFGLHTIKTRSGVWMYAGSIPEKLLIKKTGPIGDYWESPIFSQSQQAIDYFNKTLPVSAEEGTTSTKPRLTNIEHALETAKKALALRLLDKGEKEFITHIQDYDKKMLKGMSAKQSNFLMKISKRYSDKVNN